MVDAWHKCMIHHGFLKKCVRWLGEAFLQLGSLQPLTCSLKDTAGPAVQSS